VDGVSTRPCTIRGPERFATRRFASRGCRVVTSDQRLKVDATGLYTYPDVLVFCGPPVMEDGVHHTLTNPLRVVEVLSDSTEKYDRGFKFGHYRRLATLREYVLVAQDRFSVEAYLRRPEVPDPGAQANTEAHAAQWLLSVAADPALTISLGSLDVSVPLAEIYDGAEFPTAGSQAG